MLTVKRSREERVNEILTAAKYVFSEKGFRGTSMEDIIERTTLSKGGFYHYYNNKKDIFLAILREGTEVAISKIKQYKNDMQTPEEFLATLKEDLFHDLFSHTLESKMFMTLLSEIYTDTTLFAYMKELYDYYFTELIKAMVHVFPQVPKDYLEEKVKLTCYTLFAIGFYSRFLKLDDLYKGNMYLLNQIFDDGFNTFIPE